MENLLADYPVVIEIPVAWAEMDVHRHVNNAVYFRYLENARIAYFDQLDLNDQIDKTGIGRILASTSCRFKTPLEYPDKVLVGAKVTHMGEDRFTMAYRIVSLNREKIAAEGSAVIVTFNYRENKKAPIPGEWRQRIRDLEGAGKMEIPFPH